jgi:hypothetical protein
MPLPKFSLGGYVLLFTKDGDLYYQDGNNSPIKLTHVGERVYDLKLSDDNKKVVYALDDGAEYSVNSDGTHAHQIITRIRNDWLDIFETRTMGTNKVDLGFVPGTHQLLFATYLCKSQKPLTTCSTSTFFADTDTGAIKKLTDLGLALQQNSDLRNIRVSPDGKMLAVGTTERMDILSIDGKVIRHDFFSYKPSTADTLFPSFFWLPDSSGLIVGVPDALHHSNAYEGFPDSTIWRYKIDTNVAVQIPLDPPPMLDSYQVSPDGNWILYGGFEYEPTIYLGNLVDSRTKTVGEDVQAYFTWGPDSRYFIATSAGSVLGSIDKSLFYNFCQPDQWVDAAHFICVITDGIERGVYMAEINAGVIRIYDLGLDKASEYPILIMRK